jgi:hypothetical protein
MARTYFRIDRVADRYTVQIDGDGAPVVFSDRAEALSAALDIAKAKWNFAGQPTAVSYPLGKSGTDVLFFGGACNDEEE